MYFTNGCTSFFMIRKFSLFCKLIRIKTSSDSLFSAVMDSYSHTSLECPSCHSAGNLVPHGFYKRNIIDFTYGKTTYHKISVKRLKCKSCGHTHAILPDVIVPYAQYSLFFLLRVLGEYFLRFKTISQICHVYSITPSMLYRWKDLFLCHKNDWLPILEHLETSPLDFLKKLCSAGNFSVFFSCPFYKLTGVSFLQSHKNPG